MTLVECSNCGRTWNLAVNDHCPVCHREPDDPRPDGGAGPGVLLADGGVVCTDHLAKRWDERTDPDAVAPETAWERGIRIREAENFTGADEARFHVPTGTLLLRMSHTLLTALTPREDDPIGRIVASHIEGYSEERFTGGPTHA